MFKIVLPILLLFLFIQGALGQLDNSVFEDRKELEEENENKVFLGFDILGFNKNNEYFNKIADGYTLFGYQLKPHITYYPDKNVRIDAGVFLHKDFGRREYHTIAPVLSIKVKRGNWDVIFGNLDGSLNHRLIEPLYDFERVMNDRLETGLQAVNQTDRLFFDAWVNWETMIYAGDPYQEEVSGGISLDYKVIENDVLKLSFPLQTVLYHKGGQIDDVEDPLQSFMNNSIGFSLSIPVNENGILKAVRTDNHYVSFTDFSFEKQQPYTSGNGVYLNLTFDLKWLSFMTSYWYGNSFMSIKGGPIYQSVSNNFKNPDYLEQYRELLIFRLSHDVKIFDGFYLTSRFEPFFDPNNDNFEFSHSFYINYRPDFYLFKVKNKRHD